MNRRHPTLAKDEERKIYTQTERRREENKIKIRRKERKANRKEVNQCHSNCLTDEDGVTECSMKDNWRVSFRRLCFSWVVSHPY